MTVLVGRMYSQPIHVIWYRKKSSSESIWHQKRQSKSCARGREFGRAELGAQFSRQRILLSLLLLSSTLYIPAKYPLRKLN